MEEDGFKWPLGCAYLCCPFGYLFALAMAEPGLATVLECFMILAAANLGAKLVNFCYDITALLTKECLVAPSEGGAYTMELRLDFAWRS